MDISKLIDSPMKNVSSVMERITSSKYIYAIIIMFITMYGPRLSPKLPKVLRNVFSNSMFRVIILLLVVFISSNNLTLALLVSIGFMLLTSIINSQDLEEHFIKEYMENYSEFKCVTNCDAPDENESSSE